MASASSAETGHSHVAENDGLPAKRARTAVPSARQGRHREIGLMRWRPKQDAASFVGSASGIHFIRSVYSAVEAESSKANSPAHTPDRDLVPGEEDQLPESADNQSPKGIWLSHEVNLTPEDDSQKLTLRQLLGHTQNYFDHWHPAYPFLHAPSVLHTIKVISQTPLNQVQGSLPPLDLAIVRAILSMSLADSRQSNKTSSTNRMPAVLVYESFGAAIDSIQSTLSTPTTIKTLQAVLAVQLFLISMLRYNAASRLGGLATRMAFQIGLHRCPVRYTAFSAEDMQVRKRVFWTVYCMDRHLCQALGLPLGMRDDDLDVCSLDRERHAAVGTTESVDGRLALLQYLVRHAEIKGMIVELCNKALSHRQTDPDAATSIVAKINKWWNDIESFLDASEHTSNMLNGCYKTTLLVLRHECTIALNRPLLAMPKDTADYQSALQSCINAARTIINTLHCSMVGARPASQGGGVLGPSKTVPLLWPSFTWAVWQSAFIVLYAAIELELPRINADRLAEQSMNVLKHLALRGSAWPNACAAAISDLRKNLHKPHKTRRSDPAAAHQSEMLATTSQLPVIDGQNRDVRYRDDMAGVHVSANPSHTPIPSLSSTEQHHHNSAHTMGPALNNPDTFNPSYAPMPVSYTPMTSTSGMTHYDGYDNGAPISNTNVDGVNYGGMATDEALFDINNMELFEGFDIPFWLDDDQYASFLGNGG